MCFAYPNKRPKPGIWYAGTGGFAVLETDMEKYGNILQAAGQLLLIPHKIGNFVFCNVLQKIECDPSTDLKCILKNGKPGKELSAPLNLKSIPHSSLFKFSSHLMRHTVCCWERNGDPKTEFRACVLKNKIKGVRFNLLWEG